METLNKHFRHLTEASFSRYGFAQAELLARWPEIVGAHLAGHCEPDRIRWPKGTAENQRGGTLIIRAMAGRGLDVQHEVPNILSRINSYFGFGAITAVKVTQGHSLRKAPPEPPRPLDKPTADALARKLDSIVDDRLKAALARLGGGALAPRRSSPQGK